ncbi:HAD family phosphatase [Saccharopolyspora sp. TS4A08]|uniref:HAD family phosphatase n=1 Tax=Saccharopolyspora ipomoeae TaxID=3042027 RepID=A0ABT6PWG0_9PSEU|nr:HAD family phosphatase [Saccharopolyspora sp. TS4A08]MDI2032356.1 HAD family phosphatase [Saccharopolyspora sp. TS4A08]
MRWIVFDYGEVISRRITALPQLAALLSSTPEAFEPAYWSERGAYDAGLSDADYWRAVAARLDREVDDSLIQRLTSVDVDGWMSTDPETLALLEDLHRRGAHLALLSNASTTFARAAESKPWARYFEHLLFSGDLRVIKPDAEIWRILLDTLGARPEECLFFDDREENIAGARRAGLHAERWTSAVRARDLLQDQLAA